VYEPVPSYTRSTYTSSSDIHSLNFDTPGECWTDNFCLSVSLQSGLSVGLLANTRNAQ